MSKYIATFLLSFLACFALHGQDNEPMALPIDAEHFGTVYDIVEHTLKDEIWIASEKGLFSYTGKVLSPLYSSSEETFHKIYIQENRVFALSFNNSLYQLKNDSFSLIQHFEEHVKDVILVKDSIFVTTSSSLYVRRTSEVSKIYFGEQHYHHGFLKTAQGYFLLQQSEESARLYHLQNRVSSSIRFEKRIQKVFTNGGSNYLVSENSVYEFDSTSSQILLRFDLPARLFNVKLYDIKMHEDGWLAIGHNDGLSIWTPEQQKWKHYYKGTPVHAVLLDGLENIWLGTKYEGVLQIPSIRILQNDISLTLRRKEKIVTSYLTNGYLFLGTNLGSLISWNLEQNLKQVIPLSKNGEVQSIVRKNHLLYVYCDELFVIDLNRHRLVESTKVHSTKAIYVDHEVFVATSADFQNLSNAMKVDKGKWHNSIYYEPKEERFYLGTKTGLKIIDRHDFSVVGTAEAERNITEVLRLHHKIYLFDFNGNALDYGSRKASKLPISTIRSVTPINAQEVLCYNKTEVVLFNAALDSARKIHFISALTKGKYIVDLSVSASDLYITTLNKVYIVRDYADFLYQTPPSDLALLIRQKNGEAVSETIHLAHKNKGIELFLKSNQDLSFFTHYDLYYTLGEQEEEWIKIEPNQQNALQFNLAFVPEGHSVLQFILKSNDNIQKYPIKIYVNAPFYKSFWFILLLFLSITFLLIGLQKRRLSKMRKENLKRLQEERLKTRVFKSELSAIRSQMNPHFVFNTLSSIQLNIAKQKTNAAFRMVQRFSSLMRGVLNYSQKELISLKQELDILSDYLELERNRFEEELIIDMAIQEGMELEDFRIPSLITQPIAENCIQHGLKHKQGEKKISIHLHQIDERSYSLKIMDNGIGIEKANQINKANKRPASFAMKAIRKRVSYLNSLQKIHVDLSVSSSAQGTTTTINVIEHD